MASSAFGALMSIESVNVQPVQVQSRAPEKSKDSSQNVSREDITSSSAFGSSMSIGSVDVKPVQLQAPEKSKDFSQNGSREDISPAMDVGEIEMHPMSIASRSSGHEDRVETASETRRGSSDEDRVHQRHGLISEQVQTIWNPYKNRFRVMAACMTTLGNGMNDSAPGALIASLER
jgi:hypothetical protein